MRTESQKAARNRYQKKVTRLQIDFYPTEAELLAHLEKQEAKATYIKNLIRADMKKEQA